MLKGKFVNTEKWSKSYQRNNKGGGLKNLRCFPACKDLHIERGYCGVPVSFELEDVAGSSLTGTRLYAYAKFNRQDQAVDNSNTLNTASETELHFGIGAIVKEQLLEELSSEERVPRVMYKGETSEQGVGSFVFNRSNKGWSYGWHGTKHTSTLKHVLNVYLFVKVEPSQDIQQTLTLGTLTVPEGPELGLAEQDAHRINGNNGDRALNVANVGDMVCVGIFSSPSFCIFSRKKRRLSSDGLASLPNESGEVDESNISHLNQGVLGIDVVKHQHSQSETCCSEKLGTPKRQKLSHCSSNCNAGTYQQGNSPLPTMNMSPSISSVNGVNIFSLPQGNLLTAHLNFQAPGNNISRSLDSLVQPMSSIPAAAVAMQNLLLNMNVDVNNSLGMLYELQYRAALQIPVEQQLLMLQLLQLQNLQQNPLKLETHNEAMLRTAKALHELSQQAVSYNTCETKECSE